jgi:hypothetical protein
MLIDALRRRLDDPAAGSFQLLGDDLTLLSGEDWLEAARAWDAAMEKIAPSVRPRLAAELERLQRDIHAFLRRYNRSVHHRIAGYVALGQRCDFAYPWPAVAILGLEQVLLGMRTNRLYGLVGDVAVAIGKRAFAKLSDTSEDVLRRTNRGIFADSVPTVLLALRAHALRLSGDEALAAALIGGPMLPLFDAHCRAIARTLDEGLGITDPSARFSALGALTALHFSREQAIFSFHLGGKKTATSSARRLLSPRAVQAPIVREGRVKLARFALPRGFDLRDHEARVALFTRAFVDPVIRSRDDYRDVVAHLVRRWGA